MENSFIELIWDKIGMLASYIDFAPSLKRTAEAMESNNLLRTAAETRKEIAVSVAKKDQTSSQSVTP